MPICELPSFISAREHLPMHFTAPDSNVSSLLQAYGIPALTTGQRNGLVHLDDSCQTTHRANAWHPVAAADRPGEHECDDCFSETVEVAAHVDVDDDAADGLATALHWYTCTRGTLLWAENAVLTLTALARNVDWHAQTYGQTNPDPRLRRLWADLRTEALAALVDPTWEREMHANVLHYLVRNLDATGYARHGATPQEVAALRHRDVTAAEAANDYPLVRSWFTDSTWVRGDFTSEPWDPTYGHPPAILSTAMSDYDPDTFALRAPRLLTAAWQHVAGGLVVVDPTGTLPRDVVIDACRTVPLQPGSSTADMAHALLAARS